MLYSISTVEKKLAVQFETFHYTDKQDRFWEFQIESGYRWGTAIIESDKEPKADEDPYENGFVVSDYLYEDMNLDDGCWMFSHFPDDMPEEVKEYLIGIWEEDGYSGFEDNGIHMWECETIFYGPLEVELIDDTPSEPEPTPDPSKPAWPFS